jgi:thymidylate kinase
MLKIYKKLFTQLEYDNIIYCVYKGLDHLSDDLKGKRGDIDILVSYTHLDNFELIINSLGFKKVNNNFKFPRYYISRDEDTGSFVMIDLDIDIRLGHKPNCPIHFSINVNKLLSKSIFIEDISVQVLDLVDYLPLILMIRITSENPSFDNLKEIKLLYNKYNKILNNNSYLTLLLNKINPEILELNEISWANLQELYKNEILNFFAGGNIKRILITTHLNNFAMIKGLLRKVNRFLGSPPAHVHTGCIVAFVGVDGSGKSSAIDCILNDIYFQNIGLKRIYFGGNEFLIPGILKLYQWLAKTPSLRFLRVFPSFIMQIDKRARLLKALYFKAMGNVVLCDRYYYDDEIIRISIKEKINKNIGFKLLNRIQLFLMPKVLIKPDLTFYLDVSPEVAYQRKQDFSFEIMLKVNKNYRHFMKNREEVTFINADAEQKIVQNTLFKQIKYLIGKK